MPSLSMPAKATKCSLSPPKISAGAERFFEDEEIKGWMTVNLPGYPPVRNAKVWDTVRKRRVVSQTESDEYKQN